jgi:hypothetical protein
LKILNTNNHAVYFAQETDILSYFFPVVPYISLSWASSTCQAWTNL